MREKKTKNNPYKYDMISSEIERLIKEVVSFEIMDNRVLGKVTVTNTQLSKDFSHCKVFVEINDDDKKEVMDGLKNASGFVRHAIASQLDMRKTPELTFYIDDSADRIKRIEELLDKIKKDSKANNDN